MYMEINYQDGEVNLKGKYIYIYIYFLHIPKQHSIWAPVGPQLGQVGPMRHVDG